MYLPHTLGASPSSAPFPFLLDGFLTVERDGGAAGETAPPSPARYGNFAGKYHISNVMFVDCIQYDAQRFMIVLAAEHLGNNVI